MKKTIIIVGLVLALGIGSVIAYADSGSAMPFGRNFGRMPWSNSNLTDKQLDELIKERQELHDSNMVFRKEELKKALENGDITQDEYNKWSDHFEYMDEFHKENGFVGGCGRGKGMMRGMGRRHMGWY